MSPPVAVLRLLAWLLVVQAAVVLAGCGFQPRGQAQDLTTLPSPLHITGIDRYGPLHRALERRLRLAGVSLARSAADGAAELHISQHRSDARVLSVDNRNKVVENELEELARFQLRTGDAGTVSAPQTIRVLRIHFRPSSAILASEREAEQLREDMRRELAGRILQRVAAQH